MRDFTSEPTRPMPQAQRRPNSADPCSMSSIKFAMLVTLAASGCGLVDFDVDQAIPAQMIPGSTVPTPISTLFPVPLSLDLSSKIKQQNTGAINSVTLSSLELTITAPANGSVDWSFVDQVDLFVESTKTGTTLAKVKLASATKPTGQVLNFTVEGGVNLKPYVDEGAQVDSSGTGHAPSATVTYDGKAVFTVHPL